MNLMEEFRDGAKASPAFLKLMAASHGDAAPPLGFFGGLKGDDEGRIDLKRHVISRTVAAARVMALRHGIAMGATAARLDAVRAMGQGGAADLEGLRDGLSLAQDLLLAAQLEDVAAGRKPANRAPLAGMSASEQARLREAIRRLADLDEIVRQALY
jgi:CBS domain-containing protein